MGNKTCEEIILNFTLEDFKERLKDLDDVKVNLGAKIKLTYHKLAFDYHADILNSPLRSPKPKDQIIAKGMPLVKKLFERIDFFNEETFIRKTKTPEQIEYLKIIAPDYLKRMPPIERPCSSTITEKEIVHYHGDDRFSEEEEIELEIEDYAADDTSAMSQSQNISQSNDAISQSNTPINQSNDTINYSSRRLNQKPNRRRSISQSLSRLKSKVPPRKANHLLDGQRFSRQLIEIQPNTFRLDMEQEVFLGDDLVRVIKVDEKIYKHQIFFYPTDDKLFEEDFVRQWFLKAISYDKQVEICSQFIEKNEHGNYRCIICVDCPYHIGKPGPVGAVRKHISNMLFIFPCPFVQCTKFEMPFDSFSTLDKHLRSFKHKKFSVPKNLNGTHQGAEMW